MNRIRVTVVGDSGTGKTCLLAALKGKEFRKEHKVESLEPFTKAIVVNGAEYELDVCDTIGTNQFAKQRISSYKDTDVFLVCFAEDDAISFKNVVTKWFPEIKSYRPKASKILVCTKCDLKSRKIITEEIISVRKQCKASQISFCSAYSNYYVEDIFKDAILNLYEGPVPKKTMFHKLFVRCTSEEEEEDL